MSSSWYRTTYKLNAKYNKYRSLYKLLLNDDRLYDKINHYIESYESIKYIHSSFMIYLFKYINIHHL